MNLSALAAALLVATFAGSALADEGLISTGRTDSPPAPMASAEQLAPGMVQTQGQAEAPGDWARRVMAGDPGPEEIAEGRQGRCLTRADNRPHGEVWAGIGTGGYREVGGVVTQSIGDCASVTIGMSRTEGRFAGPRYR